MDRPFMEHPSGEFETAVDAMADAIKRLRALPEWDKWITFHAQGMGPRVDTYHFAAIRMRHGDITFMLQTNTLAWTERKLEVDILSKCSWSTSTFAARRIFFPSLDSWIMRLLPMICSNVQPRVSQFPEDAEQE